MSESSRPLIFIAAFLLLAGGIAAYILTSGEHEAPVVPESAPPPPERGEVSGAPTPEPPSTAPRAQIERPEPEPERGPIGVREAPSVAPSIASQPALAPQNTRFDPTTDMPNRIERRVPAEDEERPRDQQEFLDGIRDSFAEARDDLRECYELVLDLNPTVNDRLTFMIDVLPGEDEDAGIGTLQGIDAGEMELDELDCFADAVDGMSFPPPDASNRQENGDLSYSIRYPVVLTTDGPE